MTPSSLEFATPSDCLGALSMGDKQQALDWLEKAYQERSGWLVNLRVAGPGLAAFRSPLPAACAPPGPAGSTMAPLRRLL